MQTKSRTIILIILTLFSWSCSHRTPSLQTVPTEPAKDMTIDSVPDEPVPDPASTTEAAVEPSEADTESSPAEMMEQALLAYKEAMEAWEGGDTETAMSGLDAAYGIILKIKTLPDSSLENEKNGLRLMIGRRLVEFFASDQVAVGENHQFIRLEENPHVLKEIKRFQTVERRYFNESYHRSGRYRDMMRSELKQAGLPEALSWIPLIESGFKLRAYSRARALGLWQFISSTGYRFGLKKDRWVDERMDPVKATRAAVKYLKELHGYFGDWSTALAGYNCGEFRVQRVIRAQRVNYLDNFWDLYLMLPRETARFVPRFIATLMIVRNPEKYGFDLPVPMNPDDTESVVIRRPIRLSTLSKALGLENGTLAELNPELRHKATPEREYTLRIPRGRAADALKAVENAGRWIPPEATYVIHYVRPGETVSGIARRYRTSSRGIARLNRLRRYLIRPGQRLKVPSRGSRVPATKSAAKPRMEQKNGKFLYTVQRGDSLYLIATTLGVKVDELREANGLKGNQLRVGQKLEVPGGAPEGARSYVVRPGDTPYDIARKNGMTVKRFLRINRLGARSSIYPGQRVWVE